MARAHPRFTTKPLGHGGIQDRPSVEVRSQGPVDGLKQEEEYEGRLNGQPHQTNGAEHGSRQHKPPRANAVHQRPDEYHGYSTQGSGKGDGGGELPHLNLKRLDKGFKEDAGNHLARAGCHELRQNDADQDIPAIVDLPSREQLHSPPPAEILTHSTIGDIGCVEIRLVLYTAHFYNRRRSGRWCAAKDAAGGAMQNQYVGDIGDFGKYGLLREIFGRPEAPGSGCGLRLGVAWYLNEYKQGSGGNLKDYRKLKECDPLLYNVLQRLIKTGNRNVAEVQWNRILPSNTLYHSLPFSSSTRTKWFKDALKVTEGADVVFIDPDNGIASENTPLGSPQHVLPVRARSIL